MPVVAKYYPDKCLLLVEAEIELVNSFVGTGIIQNKISHPFTFNYGTLIRFVFTIACRYH